MCGQILKNHGTCNDKAMSTYAAGLPLDSLSKPITNPARKDRPIPTKK